MPTEINEGQLRTEDREARGEADHARIADRAMAPLEARVDELEAAVEVILMTAENGLWRGEPAHKNALADILQEAAKVQRVDQPLEK